MPKNGTTGTNGADASAHRKRTTKTLRERAVDPDQSVRMALVDRDKIPARVEAVLAVDKDVNIRLNLSVRPDLRRATILALSLDPSAGVRYSILRNKRVRLPPIVIEHLARDENNIVRSSLAHFEKLTERIKRTLAADRETSVKLAILSRKDLSCVIVARLKRDENHEVQQAADLRFAEFSAHERIEAQAIVRKRGLGGNK
jgi:hypothetical protein